MNIYEYIVRLSDLRDTHVCAGYESEIIRKPF